MTRAEHQQVSVDRVIHWVPVEMKVVCSALFLGAASVLHGQFERLAFLMPERCDSAVVLDADGDGDRDLIGVCRTEIVAVLLPEGELRTLWRSSDGGANIHACLWDADGDGDEDIAVGRFTRGEDGSLGWLENPGWDLHFLSTELDGIHGLTAGDLDGDGRQDLVSANVKTPPGSVAWFDGPSKALRYLDPANAGERPHYLAIGDVDDDGDPDVVLGDGGGFGTYRNPGESFSDREWDRVEIARAEGGTNVALADIDGDGDPDVIGSCGHGRGVGWYENPGWTFHPVDDETMDIHALDVGDLDGDGDSDLAFASFGGYAKPNDHRKRVFWAENDGWGSFTLHDVDTDSAQESYDLEIADVDGDGWNDIVLAGRASENLVWYRRQP